ncbi:histidine phosphatase family protein [Aquincola sp. MAHUQ-54]|uniref:Histidine phosphatase family protein n=1 Tax=Aquincola agrisoli TaxID=3119538 RepID=A0AAW9QE54_9BURK
MSEQATRLIAIRHGETDWNVGSRIQGHTDIALNANGRWQAERLAVALAEEPLDAVYASDLGRAYDTALAFARPRGIPVLRDAALRERQFGCFEGLSFDEIEQRWPDQALRWRRRDADFGPEGGETLSAFYQRIVEAVRRIALRHAGQSIAIVSHGGALDCLYRAATRIALDAPRTWQVGNASVNRLLHSEGGLTLIGWSDTGHLELAGRDAGAAAP